MQPLTTSGDIASMGAPSPSVALMDYTLILPSCLCSR